MDSLKKPEVALSAAALATSVGIGIYSYNSINELKVSVVEIKEGIVKVGNILSQSKDHGNLIGQLRELMQQLEKSTEQHEQIIGNLTKNISESNNKFNHIFKEIDQIKYALSTEIGYNQQSSTQGYYQDGMTMPIPSPPPPVVNGQNVQNVQNVQNIQNMQHLEQDIQSSYSNHMPDTNMWARTHQPNIDQFAYSPPPSLSQSSSVQPRTAQPRPVQPRTDQPRTAQPRPPQQIQDQNNSVLDRLRQLKSNSHVT